MYPVELIRNTQRNIIEFNYKIKIKQFNKTNFCQAFSNKFDRYGDRMAQWVFAQSGVPVPRFDSPQE